MDQLNAASISLLIYHLLLCILMMARSQLVYKMRERARVGIHERVLADKSGDWEKHWEKYDNAPGYVSMVLDLRKWTFKQFFPDF